VTVCSKRADKDDVGVVEAVNREWPHELPYFTFVYGEIEPATGEGSLIQAGHPHPLLRDRFGSVRRLGGGGLPIGVDVDASFDSTAFNLDPGSTLLVYSDGIVEVENAAGEAYGEAQLMRLLERRGGCPSDLMQAIDGAVRQWCCHTLTDDVSALAIQADAAS
jgi:serine phosphatase RsbU (regulator of sigma subunit)